LISGPLRRVWNWRQAVRLSSDKISIGCDVASRNPIVEAGIVRTPRDLGKPLFFFRSTRGIGKLHFERSFDHSTQFIAMISDNHKSTSIGLSGLVVLVCDGLD
jgi:hypothetical protein